MTTCGVDIYSSQELEKWMINKKAFLIFSWKREMGSKMARRHLSRIVWLVRSVPVDGLNGVLYTFIRGIEPRLQSCTAVFYCLPVASQFPNLERI